MSKKNKPVINQELEKLVKNAVNTWLFNLLTPREKRILAARFNLSYTHLDSSYEANGYHTLDEISQELGITRKRVREIQDRALNILREYQSCPLGFLSRVEDYIIMLKRRINYLERNKEEVPTLSQITH